MKRAYITKVDYGKMVALFMIKGRSFSTSSESIISSNSSLKGMEFSANQTPERNVVVHNS